MNADKGNLVYIASPYSHSDFSVMEARFHEVRDYTVKLLRDGIVAFSPIVYGHEIAKYAQLPTDAVWWNDFNFSFLIKSKVMHICLMDGWMESAGIAMEIEFAKSHGIPIVHVDRREME